MADRLKVTELDFDSIKSNLKDFLRQQSEFQDYDFEGSGLSVLLDVLAYNTHYNAYYLNMVANESFLDTSLLRNSVVSHAKKLGYTPRSTRTSRAIVNVIVDTENTTSGTLTIPRGFTFISNEIDGRTFKFTTLQDFTTSKVGTTFTFSNIPIFEGQINRYSFTHSDLSNPKQLFDLPDPTIDTSTLRVSVRPSVSNTEVFVYNLATDATTIAVNDEVYYLQEGLDGKYQIYFGEGVFGKKIPDGAVVTFEYLVSSGASANFSNSFVTSSTLFGSSGVVVDTVAPASGGAIRESVDEIKFAAPLQNISQNRAVTKNDYIKLIQQKYPFFQSVNVWGGEENDPPVFGKVFISAKPALGFEVTDTIKQFVIDEIIKPISVLTVTPVIVDVDFNFLRINCSVYFDPTKTVLSASELQVLTKQTILNFSDTSLNQFNSYFNYSGLQRQIQDSNSSIVSNELTFFVGKKFRPDLIVPNTYVLDFGFEIVKGTTNDSFYSTPDFSVLDEDGVERNCFFEEIPSSFTGVESIVILNGGFNYSSTPTIEIVGDGTGARATATIVNGKVSRIDVTNPGIGYTTATIRILGGGGSLAQASAVLEGRYGRIRIAYYKPDEITSDQTKVVLNANRNSGIVGEIDYFLGKITIENFNPKSVNNDFGDITIYSKPNSNIIQSKFNKMLVLNADDPSSVVVNTVSIR
jgi:hypothetical protein